MLFSGFTSATGSVGPDDKTSFAYLMVTCVSIGIVASIIFHTQVVRPQTSDEGYDEEQIETKQRPVTLQVDPMSVIDWIKEPQTYQVKKRNKAIWFNSQSFDVALPSRAYFSHKVA